MTASIQQVVFVTNFTPVTRLTFQCFVCKKTIFSMLKNVLIRSFHLFSSFIKTGSSIIFGVNEFQIWMHVKQIYMCVEKNQGHFISTRLKGWYCDTYLFILHSCVSNSRVEDEKWMKPNKNTKTVLTINYIVECIALIWIDPKCPLICVHRKKTVWFF